MPNFIPNDIVQPQDEKQHWEKRRIKFDTWAFSFVFTFTTAVILVVTAINETRIPEINASRRDDILSPPISFSPIAINRDLPGFNEKAYFVPPPSDLRKYSQGNYLQLIGLSSNLLYQLSRRSSGNNINESAPPKINLNGGRFQKREMLIGRNIYTSVFDVELYKNDERKIIFSLDGTQQAALLQFGLEYPSSRSICNGDYRVEIIADEELLWASKCEPGQENEIFSVPLSIPGKKTLTINITSNREDDFNWEDDLENQDVLVFTQALILKN